eukprot:g31207.t1
MRWVPSADNRTDVLSKKIASPSLFKKGADRLSGHQSNDKYPNGLVSIALSTIPIRLLLVGGVCSQNLSRSATLYYCCCSMSIEAVVCSKFGSYSEVLNLQSTPRPQLSEDAVRVRVHSCGLAFPDVLTVEGKHFSKPELPFIPCNE